MFNNNNNNNNNMNNNNHNNTNNGKRKITEVDWTPANQLNLFNLNGGRHNPFSPQIQPTSSFIADVNRYYASSSHPVDWTPANQFNLNGGRHNPFSLPIQPTSSFIADVNRYYASSSHPPPPPQMQPPSAAPAVRPFSFTSLLNDESEDENEYDTFTAEIRSQNEQINQVLSLHNGILKNTLDGMMERQHMSIQRAAEERATKKLKRKNEAEMQTKKAHIEDLEASVHCYKRLYEQMSEKVQKLKGKNRIYKTHLEQSIAARHIAEEACDSSTEDYALNRAVGPTVTLDCKVCNMQVANVLMWPCRHVCVCKQCDADTTRCPDCRVVKDSSVEILLVPSQD